MRRNIDNFNYFKDHIEKWTDFLNQSIENLNCLGTEEEEEDSIGETIKKDRQLQTITNVLYGAVANPNLLSAFINPDFIVNKNNVRLPNSKCIQQNLDSAQREAVEKALSTDSICFIQGPPGTGKTTVITEICLQLLRINPRLRILVCSETHVAVDNLIEKFYKLKNEGFINNIDTLRILSKSKNTNAALEEASLNNHIVNYINTLYKSCIGDDIVDDIANVITSYTSQVSSKAMLNKVNKEFMLNADITGVTCNSLASIDLKADEIYDYVIFDEVCKATLPEILIPLTIAKRAILVGDPKQLPPVFLQEDVEAMDEANASELQDDMYVDSLFDRLPDTNKQFLCNQYRMTKEIGNIISKYFYNSKLKNGRKTSIKDSIVWCDYKPTSNWGLGAKSPFNEDEVDIVKQILSYENIHSPKKNVAVISPYRGQNSLLRKSIDKENYSNLTIDIDTIDSFQGKDADIVIFNITRSTGSLRFFSNPRRLNVALSRAKDMCYIVGYSNFATGNETLKNIYNAIKSKEYIVSK